ncbi:MULTISPECIES: hypothetical protein [unclassified Streptomyces]|uniref:hypothetical protein n=1 Tax=unclassified Streptomyces TaxID=2593676 RepID=UPI0036E500F1
MSPSTPRSAAVPAATGTRAHAVRRIRRAAALPMPDGASMSPLAPADPLGADQDESTIRSLPSALAASRTPESEPETDRAAWRPQGTDEAGQEPSPATAGVEGAAAVAASPQRRPGSARLTSKVTERPFLVAAAVAGAVVAATPFLTFDTKDRTTTYEGLGQADPVAVDSGGAPDRHTEAYSSRILVQNQSADGQDTSADNLMDPDAGAWHGPGQTSTAGDTQEADTPVVPGVLVADTPAGHEPASGAAAASAHPRQTSGADDVARSAADAPQHSASSAAESAKNGSSEGTGSSVVLGFAAANPRTTETAAVVPAVRTTGTIAARTTAPTSTTAKSDSTAGTSPTAASTAASAKVSATPSAEADSARTRTDGSTATARSTTAVTTPTQTDDTTGTDKTADTDRTTGAPAQDREQAVSSSPAAGTPAEATASDQATEAPAVPAQERSAPQWSTKVFSNPFTLRAGESVASDRMRVTMRSGGDLVVSDENGTIRWSSHTTGQNNYATFKANGELVVRSGYLETLWSSRTAGHTGAELVIQNDGNVVILSADDQTLWAAGTQH